MSVNTTFIRDLSNELRCDVIAAFGEDDDDWFAGVTREGWEINALIKFQAKASDPTDPARLFESFPQYTTYEDVYIYVTTDESVFGRIVNVMNSGAGRNACVTISDSRIDGARLGRLIMAIMWANTDHRRKMDALNHLHADEDPSSDDESDSEDDDDPCPLCEVTGGLVHSLQRQLHGIMATEAASWRVQVESPTRLPDLKRLFVDAPGPVTAGYEPEPYVRGDPITFAGGYVAVAAVENDENLHHALGPTSYNDGRDVRALCERARLFESPFRDSTIHVVISLSCSSPITLRDVWIDGRLCVLVSGVPVTHVATVAYSLYDALARIVGEWTRGKVGIPEHFDDEGTGSYAISALMHLCTHPHGFERSQDLRRERNHAARTIERVVDTNMASIKARLWRPEGRLIRRQIESSCVA